MTVAEDYQLRQATSLALALGRQDLLVLEENMVKGGVWGLQALI